MAQKVQMPGKKPAVAPHAISALGAQFAGQSSGVARNIARLTAINKEKMRVKPKILSFLPLLRICSSVKLLSFIQALPNKPGEYPDAANYKRRNTGDQHRPPVYFVHCHKKLVLKWVALTGLWLFQIYF